MAYFGNYSWDIEMRPELIHSLPIFHGSGSENPSAHVVKLEEVCANDKMALLRLFPSTLKDTAKSWLYSLNPRSIVTWQEVETQFFKTFSPLYETHMLLQDLVNFYQLDEESFTHY